MNCVVCGDKIKARWREAPCMCVVVVPALWREQMCGSATPTLNHFPMVANHPRVKATTKKVESKHPSAVLQTHTKQRMPHQRLKRHHRRHIAAQRGRHHSYTCWLARRCHPKQPRPTAAGKVRPCSKQRCLPQTTVEPPWRFRNTTPRFCSACEAGAACCMMHGSPEQQQ